jgi:NAD(P)H dehydrogenase (quinone)
MRALVVYCHPVAESVCAAARDAAVAGLTEAGHQTDVIDLYGENFSPVMDDVEWSRYMAMTGEVPEDLRRHVDLILSAEILVFVYPTWWSGLPAMLKGWIERVLIPGVGFSLNENRKVVPGMTHVRHIYVISTFGSPRLYVKFVNDNGRRVLGRCLRLNSGLRTKVTSLGLYAMDKQSDTGRAKFLKRVQEKLACA